MAGLKDLSSSSDFDPPSQYSAVPDADEAGCHRVVFSTPSRSKSVGYLEPVEGGTFRAYYGDRDGERLGRAETIEGGVNLVAINRRARLIVEWCRTWGHLDALHDRAEDLSGSPA